MAHHGVAAFSPSPPTYGMAASRSDLGTPAMIRKTECVKGMSIELCWYPITL